MDSQFLEDISYVDYHSNTYFNRLVRGSYVNISQLLAGAIISLAIGLAGWRRGALSQSGFAGAVGTGTLTTTCGGYGRAALLVAFFLTSSALSKLPTSRRSSIERHTSKGSARDIWQVLANGGVSTAIAAIGDARTHRAAYLGSLAAVTGDTWATEIGSRAAASPRHILTLQTVPAGVSGGVSTVGTLASLAGGSLIGAVAVTAGLFDPVFRRDRRELLLTGAIAGAVGSLVDSLVGATLQERRWCVRCHISTEKRLCDCGESTRVVGGLPGLDNDAVNLICGLAGAVIGWGICGRR